MKRFIKKVQQKYPILTSILIAAFYLLIFKGLGSIVSNALPQHGYISKLIPECIGILLALLIMGLMGKLKIIRTRGNGFFYGLFTGGFLVVISLLALLANLEKTLSSQPLPTMRPVMQIVVFILTMLSVGITEEFVYRGTISGIIADKYAATKKGIYFTVFSSGLIFGFSHLTNILNGVSFESALVQSIVAAVLGMLLTAIYLRTRNIWSVVFIHSFIDFSSLIISGFFVTDSLVDEINTYSYRKLLSVFVYVIPIIIILRKSKLNEMIDNNR